MPSPRTLSLASLDAAFSCRLAVDASLHVIDVGPELKTVSVGARLDDALRLVAPARELTWASLCGLNGAHVLLQLGRGRRLAALIAYDPESEVLHLLARPAERALDEDRAGYVLLEELARAGSADLDTALRRLLPADAEAIGVERASYWSLEQGGGAIVCEGLHQRLEGSFDRGVTLHAVDFPNYFKALGSGEIIAATDAQTDARTREFAESYLRPLGIGAMLDAPVFVGGTLAGVVCHEHIGPPRAFTAREQQIAVAVAQAVSQVLGAQIRGRADAQVRGVLRTLEERDALLTDDLNRARAFQESMLHDAIERADVRVETAHRPVDEVSGDVYDAEVVDGRFLQVFLADATGHGVSAALTTMFLRSEYEVASRAERAPAAVLRALNARMARFLGRLAMRFTAVCLTLDLETGVLRWASAAHPAPCLVRDGEVIELETGGSFVGLTADAEFPEWSLAMRPRDAVCVFSDGLSEALDAQGRTFGERRLYDAVARASRAGLPLAAEALRAALAHSDAPRDDIACVVATWRPAA